MSTLCSIISFLYLFLETPFSCAAATTVLVVYPWWCTGSIDCIIKLLQWFQWSDFILQKTTSFADQEEFIQMSDYYCYLNLMFASLVHIQKTQLKDHLSLRMWKAHAWTSTSVPDFWPLQSARSVFSRETSSYWLAFLYLVGPRTGYFCILL